MMQKIMSLSLSDVAKTRPQKNYGIIREFFPNGGPPPHPPPFGNPSSKKKFIVYFAF